MSESVISVRGLSVSYQQKRVLTNIFLNIEPGHIYGVLGPNGAGKSTLFKAILGLTDINAGEIRVAGQPADEMYPRMVYVPQKNEVDWTFPATVMDVVVMGRYPHKKIFQRLSTSDYEMAENALREMGILNLRDRQIGELSGGQQQRVFLARALCQQADIFFLDEPFVGIDITTEEKIVQILKRLATEGKTLLVVHHDLGSAPDYFSRIILLNQRLIAAGPTDAVLTPENIAQAYGGQLTILHKMNG